MQGITTWLLAGIGASAAALMTWALLRSHQRFVSSGDAHMQRPSLLFGMIMPYVKAFSKMLMRYHGFTPTEEKRGGEIQTEIKSRRLFSSALDWMYRSAHRRLTAAGSPMGYEAADFLGLWIFGVVAGIGVGCALWLMAGLWWLMPLFLLVGAVLPPMWLNDVMAQRQTRIKKELPFALDLLTLSVESGMDFTASMAGIVEKLKDSPLAHEFDQVYKEINMGRQRVDALRSMRDRTNLFEMNTVVSSLIQADELGTGLGQVLRIQAEEVRRRRFELAEKRAQQAPVKMLFPLVIFIFPATLFTIASPLLVKIIQMMFSEGGSSWF